MVDASLSEPWKEINIRLWFNCVYLLEKKAILARIFQFYPDTDHFISHFIVVCIQNKIVRGSFIVCLLNAYTENIIEDPNAPVYLKVYNFYISVSSMSTYSFDYVYASLYGIALRKNPGT